MALNRKSNKKQTLPKNGDLDFGEAEQTKNNNRKFTWLNFNVIATVLVIKALIISLSSQMFRSSVRYKKSFHQQSGF